MSLSRSHKAEPEPKVEINVVPLVDIALVLLIIFMVTATFVKSTGMNFQLPSSSASQSHAQEKRELVIGIGADGAYYWSGQRVSEMKLADELRDDAASHGTDSRITIQGDARATHGRVVRAMTLAQEAGFSSLVIATIPEARNGARGR